jgi:hypothetical protein
MAQGTTSLEIRVPILNGGGTSDRTFNLNTGAITGGNILNNDGAYGIGTIIPTPSLTVSGSLTAFTSCSGFNSAEQSFAFQFQKPESSFYINSGSFINRPEFCFGLGFKYNQLDFNFSNSYRKYWGLRFACSIQYFLGAQ